MKPGNPSYLDAPLKMIFEDKEIQTNTAQLVTGNDTLIGYFGEVTLLKDQKKLYYSAIGTIKSRICFALGFKTEKDSLGFLNADIELELSRFATEKINLSVKYNPESKTVLYNWNKKFSSSGNKLEITESYFKVGMDCPDFEIQLLDGSKINLKEIKNKIVVLNWWHTRCGPCIKEMPTLNQLVESFKTRKDIIFLGICDSPEKDLTSFLENNTFRYQQGLSNPHVSEQLGGGYPQHIVIDKRGKVTFYTAGGSNNIGEEIKIELKKLTD
jgi:peroxiredoxin